MTHYGALLDPKATWLENLLLHEYMECYLYYSFLEDELDRSIKPIWEAHFQMEVAHLHKAAELLKRYERKEWREVIPGGSFPRLLQFHDTREYVRQILAEQILLTADRENYRSVRELPPSFDFFAYQGRVNKNLDRVASHAVVLQHQNRYQADYRAESKPNPVPALADRASDNTEIARNPAAS